MPRWQPVKELAPEHSAREPSRPLPSASNGVGGGPLGFHRRERAQRSVLEIAQCNGERDEPASITAKALGSRIAAQLIYNAATDGPATLLKPSPNDYDNPSWPNAA